MSPKLYIGNDAAGRRISLSLDDFVHGASSGASGLGKSRHLQHIVRQAWRIALSGAKCATIVIDPHGDLFDDLLCDAYVCGLGRRLVVFDPGPVWSPTLNPVAARYGHADVASLVMRAVHKACGDADDMQTPRLDKHLRNTFRVLQSNGATLLDGYDFLLDPSVRAVLLEQVQDHHVRAMWERFDELTDRNREERIESSENRLDKLVAGSPLMRRILGAVESSVDIGQIMAEGKHLLVNLGHSYLTHEQRKLLGALLVETIFETAVRRPRGARSKCLVIVDEAADFLAADEDLPRALAQTRKFGVHFLLAFQQLKQLSEKHAALKAAVLSNCTTRFAFGGSREDAEVLAEELFTGRFHLDEIQHEEFATKFRPVESVRKVVSRTSNSTISSGVSESESIGDAESSMTGGGSAAGGGESHQQLIDPAGGTNLISQGDMASHMSSRFAADGHSTSHTTSRTMDRSESTSYGESETLVPFMEAHEFRERTSTQYRTTEQIRERYTAQLKRQPPRHFTFQCGHHHDAISLRTPDVHPFPVPIPILERFLLGVFHRTGCMLPAAGLDAQIESRRAALRPPLKVQVSAGPVDNRHKHTKGRKGLSSSTDELLNAAKRGRQGKA